MFKECKSVEKFKNYLKLNSLDIQNIKHYELIKLLDIKHTKEYNAYIVKDNSRIYFYTEYKLKDSYFEYPRNFPVCNLEVVYDYINDIMYDSSEISPEYKIAFRGVLQLSVLTKEETEVLPSDIIREIKSGNNLSTNTIDYIVKRTREIFPLSSRDYRGKNVKWKDYFPIIHTVNLPLLKGFYTHNLLFDEEDLDLACNGSWNEATVIDLEYLISYLNSLK